MPNPGGYPSVISKNHLAVAFLPISRCNFARNGGTLSSGILGQESDIMRIFGIDGGIATIGWAVLDFDDDSASIVAAIQERRASHRSIGEMFAKDFPDRKHNRGLNFDRSILRSDQEQEVRDLFAAQRRLGNAAATEALETEVARIAFFQRPLQDSEHMVGPCQFEAGEKCTARRSYAFEMFRLLSRLAALKLTARGQEDRSLNAEEVALAASDFGKQKKLTWKWLRKTLDLDSSVRFAGITDKDESNDFVARSGNAAEGTYTLRDLLGDAGWRVLMHNPVQRDRIAEVLTFREDPDSIRKGLTETGIEPLILAACRTHVFQ